VTESSTFVIAWWLLPAEPARAYFQEIIERLAAKYDGPAFEPHLTLAVGPDRRDKAERTLAGLTTGSIGLRFIGLSFSPRFIRTFFVRFAPSAALLHLRDSLGMMATEPFDPHLSLLYQKLPGAEQKRLAVEIQLPFRTVTFDCVAATRCRLPVTTAADVNAWETITSRRLGR
jgi:2'-5' RNA ligase